MSRQSDTEFLISCAILEYQKTHGLDNKEAKKLFEQHFVWEQMLSQHEYLHQVAMQEVHEYVEELMQEDRTELYLFHGTTAVFDTISLEKSKNRRDFGKGFYTTVLESQSKEWGKRLRQRRYAASAKYYVYEYAFRVSDDLSILRFNGMNLEWLDFVKENRKKGGIQHQYDVVIGPVADDRTSETISLYVNGTYTAEEALRRLTYDGVNNQISFHTEKALSCLKQIRREEYE